jgi:F0F1-type ATP synthase membrane subunit b/b'
MFLTIDGTFWVQLINFGIFYLILRVVFLRPVEEAVRERRAYIEGVERDYDEYRKETKDLRAEADRKRAVARREAEEVVAKARSAANDEAAAIGADYGSKATAIADDARNTVEAEMVSARKQEPELAGALAKSLLDRAIGALNR